MKWLLKTNSTPFGNSHWKTSSPMASPPTKGGSNIPKNMKGGSKNE